MAMRVALFGSVVLVVGTLSGCMTRTQATCIGESEALGYQDGIHGTDACRAAVPKAELADYRNGWDEGIRRFCTLENGYQQGCQGAAIVDVCLDEGASAYLDGYQSGYSVYLMQLEVDALERTIDTKSDLLEQIWGELDAVSKDLAKDDVVVEQRERWLENARALTRRQDETRSEIDELELDLSARKLQLTQMRRAIAVND